VDTILIFTALTLIGLAVLLLGLFLGLVIPWRTHRSQILAAILGIVSALAVPLSMMALLTVGLLTIWPSLLLLGLAVGWSVRFRAPVNEAFDQPNDVMLR